MNDRSETAICVVGIICGLLLLASCDEDGSKQALVDQGYTKINMTGAAILGCDRNDFVRNSFEADTVTGQRVRGVVCSDPMKGYTIRTLGRVMS